MSKKYTVAYFIKKFSAIPLRKWTTGVWYNSMTGACCAQGHCGVRTSGIRTPESCALRDLFRGFSNSVTTVNDFKTKKFPQTTPRGRILAALRSLKKS